MLNLTDFAKEVHAVAVEHGWWEGERDESTLVSLMCCEVAEAMEEYRAGRPMVWHLCMESGGVCDMEACENWEDGSCATDDMTSKPEGIAVELVDGCIRILDLMAAKGMDFEQAGYIVGGPRTLPKLVAVLHYATAKSAESERETASWLNGCIEAVREWLDEQGVDFEEVLRTKHEYNKTRPYRHGGKRC